MAWPGSDHPVAASWPSRVQKRAEIWALDANGFSPSAMVWLTGCAPSTVRRWTARLHRGAGLRDRPRTGRPATFTEDLRVKTVAFYCQASPLPNGGSWSLRWAEKHLREHTEILGGAVSRSSLQRILKSHPLRPHLHKYFLHITDPDFFPKAEALMALYLNPPDYYFCMDECPGIQALRRLDPSLGADEAGRVNYEGFDYERKGTVDLFAFLAPNTGDVFGRCRPNHNTETLCHVFREQVQTQPAHVQLHYVMDNLSPHFHDQFCFLVAELSEVTYEPKATGAERRAWLGLDDKRIVIHFTPFHGSWLNMVEIWFGILNQKCLKHMSFQSVMHLLETLEQFIQTWNEAYAHPFTWTYTGEGLHGKAVRRFRKLLSIESAQMDAKYLASQLLLMSNLAQDYASEVPPRDWLELRELFVAKSPYIAGIIDAETGPRRLKRARKALQQFNETMIACLN